MDWSFKNQAVLFAPENAFSRKRKRGKDTTPQSDSESKIIIFQPKTAATNFTPQHVSTLNTTTYHGSLDPDQAFWDERGKNVATLDSSGKFVLWGAPQYSNVWRALGAVDAGSRVMKFKWLRYEEDYISTSQSLARPVVRNSTTSKNKNNVEPIDLTSDDDGSGANGKHGQPNQEPFFVKGPLMGPRGPAAPSKPGRLDGFVVVTEDGKIILYFQDASNVVRFITATIPGMEKPPNKPSASDHDNLPTPDKLTHVDIYLAESDHMFLAIYGPGTSERCIWTYDVEVDIRTESMIIHPSAVISVASPFMSDGSSATSELATELPASSSSSVLSLHVLNPKTVIATFGRLASASSSSSYDSAMNAASVDTKPDDNVATTGQGAVCVWELVETDAPPGDDGGIFGQDRDAKIITWVLVASHGTLSSFPTALTTIQPWYAPPGIEISAVLAIGYSDGALELLDSKTLKKASLLEFRFGPLKSEADMPPPPPRKPATVKCESVIPNGRSVGSTSSVATLVDALRRPSVVIREDQFMNDMMDWSSAEEVKAEQQQDVDEIFQNLMESPEADAIADAKDIVSSLATTVFNEPSPAHTVTIDREPSIAVPPVKTPCRVVNADIILALSTSPNGVNVMAVRQDALSRKIKVDMVPMVTRDAPAARAHPEKVVNELTRQVTLSILNNKDGQDLIDLIHVLSKRLPLYDLPELVLERVYSVIGGVLRPLSPHIASIFPHNPESSEMNVENRVIGFQLSLYRSIPTRQCQYSNAFVMISLHHILRTFFQCCNDTWDSRNSLLKLVKERTCIDTQNIPITMRKDSLHYFLPLARWGVELVCVLLREFYMTVHIRRRKKEVFQTPGVSQTPGAAATPTLNPGVLSPQSASDEARRPWKGDFENQDLLTSRPTKLALLFHTPTRRLIKAILFAARIFKMQLGFNIATVKNQYQSAHASAPTAQRQKILEQLRNDANYLQRADLIFSRPRLKLEVALSLLFDIDDIISRPRDIATSNSLNPLDVLPPDTNLSEAERRAAYDSMLIRSIVPPSYATTLPLVRQKYDGHFIRLFSPIVAPPRPAPGQGVPPQPEDTMTNLSAALMLFATDQSWLELKPMPELDTVDDSNTRDVESFLVGQRQRFDVLSKTNFWFAKGIRQCNRCGHTSGCVTESASTATSSSVSSNNSSGGETASDVKSSPLSLIPNPFKGRQVPWGDEFDAACICGGSWKQLASLNV
ncbi:hypothetical protein SmJEL517_g05669 [Synchytrium microbalum]|uniref:Mediator complex subunit 16 n=1 Tax=Synchytrium microbalum TaxID=1806994 RepID=A0A507BYS5_9FUNG|nr:uncharacterized protein SmJEL517_g05669 [Synchytrium microbalum]TPX30886.1 hypothetical protein SmJEL517_g05669 [Synchytrium microbalum]